MLSGSEGSFGDELEKEISLLLREQRRQDDDDFEKELNLYRSGSAPPTVEGSLSAVGGLYNHGGGGVFLGFSNSKKVNGSMSEEELRSDPAYLSYYYSNANLNPRLPPPLLSKEDWRLAQRLQGGNSSLGGIGDRRKLNRNDSVGAGRSLFTMPPGFSPKKGEREGESESELEKVNCSAEWGGDGLIGLPGLGLGGKKKSIAEIFQDDIGRAASPQIPSRPSSRTAFDNGESLGLAEAELAHLHGELASKENLRTSVSLRSPSFQNNGPPASHSYASVIGASLPRSTTPDPKVIARTPSPCLPPIGGERVNASDKRSNNGPNLFNSVSATIAGSTDLVTAFSGMNLSNGVMDERNHIPTQSDDIFQKTEPGGFYMPYKDLKRSGGSEPDFSNSSSMLDRQASLRRTNLASPNNTYPKTSPASTLDHKSTLPSHYQHADSVNPSLLSYGLGGYSAMPSMMAGHLGSPNMASLYDNAELQNLSRTANDMGGNTLQAPLMDPMHLQYLAAEYAALNDPNMGNAYVDLLQKAYMGSLLSPQKSPIGGPMGGKSGISNHNNYHRNHTFGVGLSSYRGSPLSSPVLPNSPGGPVSPLRHGHGNMQYLSSMRNPAGGVLGHWNLQGGYGMEGSFGSSLLEEFKCNKAHCFELSEIAGHVVEFSTDQYGSRFIQQKLETATIEEKNMVFEEINPQALTLMTDVFGNYVIQKFFELGIASQRRELADKLLGNVLTLSLQMYGCRVIQKAIEVVDLDQKIKMVGELDGYVMRCVRDQNGNHVIQKCIECVPEKRIQFIVTTFFDQVVSLSIHPYGCRVIQRILEHCADPQTQSKVMEEILGAVSMLAQDQYGNYVVQHVLEHGKPDERSTIIKELAGKIVKMSQQKFASNVVEKCLTFGGPAERLLLVNEMLGTTDENEPLQAMMKDQFANYVVQKVLETCDDQQRELILSRIKVHLNALKKYTYGKHIVARVEKLVAAGERRIAIAAQSSHPAI